jgi:hypothetical protein
MGVLPVGDRLVSWGRDGAVRFWSRDGAALPGGAADAHYGGVKGVLRVGDRLVSWGGDGAIRFWSLEGTPIDPDVLARAANPARECSYRR